MASLNHVCMWSEHGWIRISAEEAARIHPRGTVSVHSGLFMCELCGQYVTLTSGETRTRHFRHSAHEADKNCPERTFGSYYIPTYKAGDHELPLRIVFDRETFSFELGLLYIPKEVLDSQPARKVTIYDEKRRKFVYSFERLNTDSITYVSIGDDPSTEYYISASRELTPYWPEKIKGIDNRGAVFDGQTGKLLSTDADVKIGSKYLLLTDKNTLEHSKFRSIELNKVSEKRNGWTIWRIYEVEAKELSEEAAKFFLNLHCRLTDVPIKLTPLWPIHIETPYVIKHDQNAMIMHVSGNRNAIPMTFPKAGIIEQNCSIEGKVLKIFCNGRQQLISAGNANVLQYVYLWRERLAETKESVSVIVTDESGSIVPDGLQISLPEGKLLIIETLYDGHVIMRNRDQAIINKIPVSAKERLTISDLKFGLIVEVLQGLDTIWQAVFEKAGKDEIIEDERLYSILTSFKGNEIEISHSIAGLVDRLGNYPRTKRWLRERTRYGIMPEKSMKYLRRFLSELPRKSKGAS